MATQLLNEYIDCTQSVVISDVQKNTGENEATSNSDPLFIALIQIFFDSRSVTLLCPNSQDPKQTEMV